MAKFCSHCNQNVEGRKDPATGRLLCLSCGNVLGLSAEALPPGTLIAGFRIDGEVGRGGMGVVYRATQLNLSRTIALKVLSDELSSDSVFVESFFHEARAAACLSHPNIVQAYDAGMSEDGIYYLAMEYVNGETLEVKLSKTGPLSCRSSLLLGIKISDALGYAWNTRKICHGDIKPDNILVSSSGDLKLADLGLAKSMYDEGVKRDVMVTPLYAAPEIICGKVTSANLASDIYSFGATMYHVVTGHPPFDSEKLDDIYRRHLTELPIPPSQLNKEISPELSNLILQMLSKKPEDRPVSWDALTARFHEIMENSELPVRPTTAGNSAMILLWAGILVLVLILAAGGWLIWNSIQKDPKKTEPPISMRTPEKPPSPAPVFVESLPAPSDSDAKLMRQWRHLQKELSQYSPIRRSMVLNAFLANNNLQEELQAEVRDAIQKTHAEIRSLRLNASVYANDLQMFNKHSGFYLFLDRPQTEAMLSRYELLSSQGRYLPHLEKIYLRRKNELETSAWILRLRLKFFQDFPASLLSVKFSGEKSKPSKASPAPRKKTDTESAERVLIQIFSRQVRNFSPEILCSQLHGLARKYRESDPSVALKATLTADALLTGDALSAFLQKWNEALKGIPLPGFEKDASYVGFEANFLKIMISDGKMTLRKRLRLTPAVLDTVKRSFLKAFADDAAFRSRCPAELQIFLIVNSFFYDTANAKRNIIQSSLPAERKQLLENLLQNIRDSVEEAI